MSNDVVKEAAIHSPAYVSMEILKSGGGKFSVDDRMGWRWSGDDESFLLGILRVGKSSVAEQFDKELDETSITKNDIKRAIRHSLAKDPKDGLFTLIGDNQAYRDFQGLGDSEWSDRDYEVKECLENNFYDKDKASAVSDDILDKGLMNVRSSENIFNEYEKEIAKNFEDGKTWYEYVEEGLKACDHHRTARDFMTCIQEHIWEEEESVREGFFEKFREVWREDFEITDDELKELSEKHEIPEKIMDHCAHGGWAALEGFRPISEKQTFLESY